MSKVQINGNTSLEGVWVRSGLEIGSTNNNDNAKKQNEVKGLNTQAKQVSDRGCDPISLKQPCKKSGIDFGVDRKKAM